MIRTASALVRVRNDKVPPKRLTQLFFILSKAVLDYPGPILHLQDQRVKDKFSKLSYKTFRLIMGLSRSSPIKIIHQICGTPEEEWERRNLYYSLGIEGRHNHQRYLDLVAAKEDKAKLRQTLTWPMLRLASIPKKAKGFCANCSAAKVTPIHIIEHAGPLQGIMTKIFGLLDEVDSVRRLAGLSQDESQQAWIFYKKTFKFK